MSKKFNLAQLLNNNSKPAESVSSEQVEITGAGSNEFKVQLISVKKLIPSKDNFYDTSNIADLKDAIEVLGGIKQNLIVKPIIGTDQYTIIAGHRRSRACSELVTEGKGQYEFVPCEVESNIDEIKEKIMLIYTNSTTRELSTWEKVEQLNQLKALLTEYKRTHELPGRVRELLAEALNVSTSQVARMESINNNLLPELKEELKNNKINFSAASELARLSAPDQMAVYEQHQQTGVTDLKTVREQKEKAQTPILESERIVNPTIEALLLVKGLLMKESGKPLKGTSSPASGIEIAINNEYRRIMAQQAKEIQNQLDELKGSNVFEMDTGMEV